MKLKKLKEGKIGLINESVLSDAARRYSQDSTNKNYYNDLKKSVFDLEWQDIVEELINLEKKQSNNDIAEGVKLARQLVKRLMKG